MDKQQATTRTILFGTTGFGEKEMLKELLLIATYKKLIECMKSDKYRMQ